MILESVRKKKLIFANEYHVRIVSDGRWLLLKNVPKCGLGWKLLTELVQEAQHVIQWPFVNGLKGHKIVSFLDFALIFFYYLGILIITVFILQAIAFSTLLERHFLGRSQCRICPNKVVVERRVIAAVHFFLVVFFVYASLWFCFNNFFRFTLPYFFCLSSILGFLFILLYFLVFLVVASILLLEIMCLCLNNGLCLSFSFCLLFFAFFSPFFCLVLVDLHRAPFDFSECESELVSGFNVKYSSAGFLLYFWVSMVFDSFINVLVVSFRHQVVFWTSGLLFSCLSLELVWIFRFPFLIFLGREFVLLLWRRQFF
ncbi:unnamed protein product, partial [Onchocerca flexuosa]|uniref:NADH-ubiquinone oxidoreductase chain 1 n=1 Tax=Onchocerca flexuosa TaxID=387005 RepID=A0A183HGI3_9BILA